MSPSQCSLAHCPNPSDRQCPLVLHPSSTTHTPHLCRVRHSHRRPQLLCNTPDQRERRYTVPQDPTNASDKPRTAHQPTQSAFLPTKERPLLLERPPRIRTRFRPAARLARPLPPPGTLLPTSPRGQQRQTLHLDARAGADISAPRPPHSNLYRWRRRCGRVRYPGRADDLHFAHPALPAFENSSRRPTQVA